MSTSCAIRLFCVKKYLAAELVFCYHIEENIGMVTNICYTEMRRRTNYKFVQMMRQNFLRIKRSIGNFAFWVMFGSNLGKKVSSLILRGEKPNNYAMKVKKKAPKSEDFEAFWWR